VHTTNNDDNTNHDKIVPEETDNQRKIQEEKEDEEDDRYDGLKESCPICTVERPVYKIHRGECGHAFCRRCVGRFFREQISSGVVSFTCMETNCERTIEEKEIFEFFRC